MAKKKNNSPSGFLRLPSWPEFNLEPEIKKGILVVILLAAGAIGILSLFDMAGLLGGYYQIALEYLWGWGKFVFPIMLLGLGYFLYYDEKYEVRGANYLGLLLFSVFFPALLQLFVPEAEWGWSAAEGRGGGHLGQAVASGLVKLMGLWAALIVILSLLLVSFMLMFNSSISRLIGRKSWFGKLFALVFVRLFHRHHDSHEDDEEDEEEEEGEENEEEDDEEDGQPDDENEDDDGEEEKADEENDKEDGEEDQGDDEDDDEDEDRGAKRSPAGFSAKKISTGPSAAELNIWRPTDIHIDLPIELLPKKIGKPKSGDIKKNMEIIEKTLSDFGISVEMGEVSIGPTVTQYTFKPAEGIKLSRITALNNDLALALAAHPLRIEAPIPGKALVGLEVPNQTKAIVGLREVLDSQEFHEKKSNLTIALGKDVSGKVWVGDIARMPHLLVAGATNTGKSVCLNTIIISLLYQNNPDDLRLIMVDPKRVELTLYNGIPHLLTPVITDAGKTINALKWCLNEMDRRYDLLSRRGKKNIQTFNASASQKLPYIIFVIDELADLMMVSARDVEAAITRLLQMARAVGIHLVLATQRPSVDVITGLIKANMPARIAFTVASLTDSRTILDAAGAEKLLGSGDMLFTTAEISKPKRIQGAFVSETEIKRIIRAIKEEADEPCYLEGVTDRQKVGGIAGIGMGGNAEPEDDLFDDALELVVETQKASTSFLQRKLGIGYGRAAKLLDSLSEAGIVSNSSGPKGREVLVTREQYERMKGGMTVSAMPIHRREESRPPDNYLDEDEIGQDDEEEDDDGDNSDDEDEENDSEDWFKDEEREGNENESREESMDQSGKNSQIQRNRAVEQAEKKDFEDQGKYFSK